ncbi:hypothetical protein MY4824_009148 [Beauveria thailandica]
MAHTSYLYRYHTFDKTHLASQNWCLCFVATQSLKYALSGSNALRSRRQNDGTSKYLVQHYLRPEIPRQRLKGSWIRLLLDWNFPANSYIHASRQRRPSPELVDKAETTTTTIYCTRMRPMSS